MPKLKYTKDFLEPIISKSSSYYQVLRELGLDYSGSNNTYIRSLVKKFGLNVSHFLGSGHNLGQESKNKLESDEVLMFDRLSGRREHTSRLRRALIESGVLEQCEICGLHKEWNGKPIVLTIDHKDGNGLNNLKSNLRFLCPNCHTQTPNYGVRNKKTFKSAVEEIQYIEDREVFRMLNKAIKGK